MITSLDHKNNSHNKAPIGWISQWKAQVCVRKTRIEMWRKTQEITLENTLESSPFDMEVFALKQVEKTSKMDGKN